MYPAPIYTETDPAFIAEVMRTQAFACLTSMTDDGLKATHAPLVYRAEEGSLGTIYGHYSSHNPQCAAFDGRHAAMAVFTGPHAYVSPNWKSDPQREVPTWDFISVQATGRPTALAPEDAPKLIGELVEIYEGRDGWRLAGMKQSYRDKLIARVTPFRMPVDALVCNRKLHQGASPEDRALIIARLRARGEAAAAAALEAVGAGL